MTKRTSNGRGSQRPRWVLALVVLAALLSTLVAAEPSSARSIDRKIRTCNSVSWYPQNCTVYQPGEKIRDIYLTEQHSASPCIEGRSYGVTTDGRSIWVDRGCRATFLISSTHHFDQMWCSSWNSKPASCQHWTGKNLTNPMLMLQVSRSPCTASASSGIGGAAAGDTFYAIGPWLHVEKGCRGKFLVMVS